MITAQNFDTKKYRIVSADKSYFLGSGDKIELDCNTISAFRVYADSNLLNRLIKVALFLLCIFFVFLDTDYENGEFMLISVSFKCRAKTEKLRLEFTPSSLININKSGELEAEFNIEKSFLIAHIISVLLYSVLVIALFIFLGVFTSGEALSPLFYVLSVMAVAFAAYIIYFTIKRYKKTLVYLTEYFKNYVF